MVEHVCNLCGLIFDHKGAHDRHMNRKKSCKLKKYIEKKVDQKETVIISTKVKCNGCNKLYATEKSYRRHKKYFCKNIIINNDDNLNDDYTSQESGDIQKIYNELLEAKKEIQILKKNIAINEIKQNITAIKQKSIPKNIKIMIWNTYIGKEKGIGNCYVCPNEIDSKHFECGHIIARSKGGLDTIDNLRCVCSVCNKSIGNKNMDIFKEEYLKNKQASDVSKLLFRKIKNVIGITGLITTIKFDSN